MTDSGGRPHSIVEKVFTKSAVNFILNTTVWVTLADGMVIGNFLGADAVAAYGLAWPVVVFVWSCDSSPQRRNADTVFTADRAG